MCLNFKWIMETEVEDDNQVPNTTKKWNVTGQMSEEEKTSFMYTWLGALLLCLRFKCFQTIKDAECSFIILHFNKITVNEQNAYLAGLVIINTTSQRGRRQPEEYTKFHDYSYSYCVQVDREHSIVEIPVCVKVFMSLHRILKKKVQVIQCYFKRGEFLRMARVNISITKIACQ